MNRSEPVRQVAGETGLGAAEADAAVKALLAALAEGLARDGTVRLAGFGTFAVKDRPARTGRNPRSGRRSPSRPRGRWRSAPAGR